MCFRNSYLRIIQGLVFQISNKLHFRVPRSSTQPRSRSSGTRSWFPSPRSRSAQAASRTWTRTTYGSWSTWRISSSEETKRFIISRTGLLSDPLIIHCLVICLFHSCLYGYPNPLSDNKKSNFKSQNCIFLSKLFHIRFYNRKPCHLIWTVRCFAFFYLNALIEKKKLEKLLCLILNLILI